MKEENKKILSFDKYNKINEDITLNDDEKNFLWKKIEYKKKKSAIETENALYKLLQNKGDKAISNDDFKMILKSLEYTFRKKLSGIDKPMKSAIFTNLVEKIPSDWVGVKYSSINSKHKRENKVPTILSRKDIIVKYLDKEGIDYDVNMTKRELIDLIKK